MLKLKGKDVRVKLKLIGMDDEADPDPRKRRLQLLLSKIGLPPARTRDRVILEDRTQ
jgi:hypothetical protein